MTRNRGQTPGGGTSLDRSSPIDSLEALAESLYAWVEKSYTGLIGFFSARGPLAGRFKVRPCFYPSSLNEILLMSRLASPKTAQIWAERIALCERSKVPIARFCQSIGCSLRSFFQWKRKLVSATQSSAFLVSKPPSRPKTPSRSNSRKQANRREALGNSQTAETAYHARWYVSRSMRCLLLDLLSWLGCLCKA